MVIRLKDNQTVWDFCLMVTGNFDNIIQFMTDNGISTLDEDLSGRIFDVTYNTNDKLVNNLFLNQISIASGDISMFNEINTDINGQFNSDYDSEFKN
jgi:hypothetical protein